MSEESSKQIEAWDVWKKDNHITWTRMYQDEHLKEAFLAGWKACEIAVLKSEVFGGPPVWPINPPPEWPKDAL